jgi:uncharacterized protein
MATPSNSNRRQHPRPICKFAATPSWPSLFALMLAWLLLSGQVAAEIAIPAPQGRVTDLTGTLTNEVDAELEARLDAFAMRTGAQLVVLMLPTTGPENIEAFSMRVVEDWKPGQKGKDNGVLLVVAKEDRRIRIEVGYGLEATLTDIAARRIIAGDIKPAFKRGEFVEGITRGIERIMQTVDGNELSGVSADGDPLDLFFADMIANPIPATMFGIVILGFCIMYAYVISTIVRFTAPSLPIGVAGAVVATVIALIAGAPTLVALVVAGAVFPFALIVSLFWRHRHSMRFAVGGSRSSGGSSADWDSGRSSSSFSSGGSFGGGGASGSW